jgi:hypothetical protein
MTILTGIKEKQMGSLGNDLRNVKGLPYNKFRVDEILEQMNEEDQKDFLESVMNPNLPAAWIVRVLRRHGHTLSENAIRSYRKAHNVVE